MIRKTTGLVMAMALFGSAAWADVSGDWDFAVDIGGMGSGNANVTLQEAGDGTLTGNYSGQLGNSDFTGESDGTEFTFELVSQMGSVTYSGALQEDGTLSGTMDLGGMGGGTFVATRR